METSVMIRQLRRTAKKHENETVHTFDTNISAMCTDVANRLEELENEKAEIRSKAIEEFAEQIKARAHSTERNDWSADYMISIWESVIDEIAKELKGE